MELVVFHGFDAIPGDLIAIANAVRWAHPDMTVRLLPGPIVRDAGRAWWVDDDPLFGEPADTVEWLLPQISDAPVIVAGFSQGGGLALAAGFSGHANIVGVASISGFIPDDIELRKIDASLFIAHGDQDQIVDIFHATSLLRKVDRLGITCSQFLHKGGHVWTDEVTDEFVKWLGTLVG
jgi:predicted esterase